MRPIINFQILRHLKSRLHPVGTSSQRQGTSWHRWSPAFELLPFPSPASGNSFGVNGMSMVCQRLKNCLGSSGMDQPPLWSEIPVRSSKSVKSTHLWNVNLVYDHEKTHEGLQLTTKKDKDGFTGCILFHPFSGTNSPTRLESGILSNN